ncbi:CHAT domain-containing protein [Mariniblastus fucicola]|uniref:CHAT domain protein n=1 Tax=Mariniblastus fucicola TaxID=980251 RepID=A0A5B9PKG6_9BACT|nr:CHAT domain-containing protein [Mariniblastus fucicola]QEG25196.1 CHAT domain protein [Mariniblastus fucicola]
MKKFKLIIVAVAMFICCSQSQAFAWQAGLGQRMDAAIKMMRDAGNNQPEAIIAMLNAGAQGYFTSGDLDKAIARIDEAIALARKENRHAEFMTSMDIAARILARKDDESAYRFLTSQLRASGDKIEFKKQVLKAIKIHLMKTGNVPLKAISDFEMLQIVHKDNPGSEEEYEALMSFGSAAVQNKIFDLGGEAIREAKGIASKLERNDLLMRADAILGMSLLGIDSNEAAETLLSKTIELQGEGTEMLRPMVAHSLAQSQIKQGKWKEATRTIDKATGENVDSMVKLNLDQLRVPVSMLQADAGDKSERAAALKAIIDSQTELVAEKEKTLLTNGMDKKTVSGILINDRLTLASFLVTLNQLDEANKVLDEIDRAIVSQQAQYKDLARTGIITGEMSQRLLSDQISESGEYRQQILIKQKRYREALVLAENTRGRSQVEMLREKLGVAAEDETKALSFDDMAAIAKEQKTTLVMYSIAHLFDRQTRAWLPKNHSASRPHAIFAWVIQPNGDANFVSVPLRGSLDKLVALSRSEILARPKKPAEPKKAEEKSDETKQKARDASDEESVAKSDQPVGNKFKATQILTTLLIDPIEKWLPKDPGARVTFMPQGSLYLVPFAALPDKDGEPLLVKHTISYAPSIEMMRLAKQQQREVASAGSKEILIVGNPNMPSYQSRPDKPPKALTPLKGAEAEAKYLGDLLGVKPMIGEDATEVAVAEKMKSARFIHLATHGLLESENGFTQGYLSAVALGPSEGEDGFLTVRETMRMDLKAELVVLSACDTGRGVITGDGVIGLSQGYVSAGVPTIVVSLWPVSDQATAVLMSYFYQAMLKGADKATALRLAMLKTREKFPAPRLWAPFSLSGVAQ